VRRIKEALWSTFGINRIKPFGDNYSRSQMKEWKTLDNVQKVHEELYMPSDPNDPSSDIYITLIIKSVFPSENERTRENGIWVQSVLEAIFDEKHLSPKIDTEVLDSWIDALTDDEHDVNNYILLYDLVKFIFFLVI
jgi:ATP-dependent exoDNAse (exonuclease V) beta subunit